MTAVLERNGMQIVEDKYGHYAVTGATCECGHKLRVAPAIYQADHRKGDPVVVCDDFGVHAYRWLELVPGRQPTSLPEPCWPLGQRGIY
jgi:hypothetical protein